MKRTKGIFWFFSLAVLLLTLLPARPSLVPVAQAADPPSAAVASGMALNEMVVTTMADSLVLTLPGDFAAARQVNRDRGNAVTLLKADNSDLTLADVGAVYGVAFDSGAVSGKMRVFLTAYTRTGSGYGAGGPGGVYEYRFDTRKVRLFATLGAGADCHGGEADNASWGCVGRTGLGDAEVSPDERARPRSTTSPARGAPARSARRWPTASSMRSPRRSARAWRCCTSSRAL